MSELTQALKDCGALQFGDFQEFPMRAIPTQYHALHGIKGYAAVFDKLRKKHF